MFRLSIILCALAFVLPSVASAQTSPDLAVYARDISFSSDPLVSGTSVRIYAEVHNEGDVDASAYVFFYQGEIPIGASQVVTVAEGGTPDQVWVDFTIPYGAFNVRAEVRGQDPGDINGGNDLAITQLFQPIEDDDMDGIENTEDNCPADSNPGQMDSDGDGAGNACDDDDDNDGLSDEVEVEQGTDQFNPDTDGDGVDDSEDYAPLNSEVQEQPSELEPEEEPDPEPEPEEDPEPESEEDEGLEEDEEPEEGEEDQEESDSIEELDSVGIFDYAPSASFVFTPTEWKTFNFRSLHPAGQNVTFEWDFGDGVTSAQSNIDHTYRKPGKYVVTLMVTDDEGNVVAETAEVNISFWHLNNPVIKLLLGILVAVLLSSLLLAFWHKKRKKKRIEVVETSEDSPTKRKTIKRKK